MGDLYLEKIHNEFGFMVKKEEKKKDKNEQMMGMGGQKKKLEKMKFSEIEKNLLQLKNAQE